MKRNRNAHLLFVLSLSSSLSLVASLAASESPDALNPLYGALQAERFVAVQGWESVRSPELPLSQTNGVFEARAKDGSAMGTVVHSEAAGYGGAMGILTSFDPNGTVIRVTVFRHIETQCHVASLSDGRFLDQFAGLRLTERLSLMVGEPAQASGDVLAMTGGTVTSRAVAGAVAEARVAYYILQSRGFLKTP